MSPWNDPELKSLFLTDTPLIDVRAPVEFSTGSVPHSFNFPIMTDSERHLVGTCYVEKGQAEAIKLGHELVSGDVKKDRITAWTNFIANNPRAQVFCFRGGLRSQISCQWLKEAGIERTPIKGGYKRMRNFFLSHLNEAPLPTFYRLGGYTGSGKTNLLNLLPHSIDLEGLASHRGSAFGSKGKQPSQVKFENDLSLALMRNPVWAIIEDESPLIGRIALPQRFLSVIKSAPMIILNVPLEERIQNIFQDYVKNSDFKSMHRPLSKVANRLGGVRFKEIEAQLREAFLKDMTIENHEGWISGLLKFYYDKAYEEGLRRNKDQIIFRGNAEEIREYIKHTSISRQM